MPHQCSVCEHWVYPGVPHNCSAPKPCPPTVVLMKPPPVPVSTAA